MQGADKGTAGELAGTGLRIGIVQARFNAHHRPLAETACRAELLKLEVAQERDITHAPCPVRWKCRWR
jgi:6,7-dimethyl-8-ribityllumazine synthase